MRINVLLLGVAVASYYFSDFGAQAFVDGFLMPAISCLSIITLVLRLLVRFSGQSSDYSSAVDHTDGAVDAATTESFWRNNWEGLCELKRGAVDVWESAIAHFDSSSSDSSDSDDSGADSSSSD